MSAQSLGVYFSRILSMEEAKNLEWPMVEPEHLLLGALKSIDFAEKFPPGTKFSETDQAL